MDLESLYDDAYMDIVSLTEVGERPSTSNYLNQDIYVTDILDNSAIKSEKELFEKWGIPKTELRLNGDDSTLRPRLLEYSDENYYYARSMEEFLTEDMFTETKSMIIEEINRDLDRLQEENDISEQQILQMKDDAKKITDQNFEEAILKIKESDVREKLESLCNKWEDAYKNTDYDLMNELAENIEECYGGKNLYRDSELQSKARAVLIKNLFIRNKLEDGKDGLISDIEEDVIKHFTGKELISYIPSENRKDVEKYRDLFYRRNFINDEEFSELEELKDKLSKVEDLPKGIKELLAEEL